jgi:hypothetical protein
MLKVTENTYKNIQVMKRRGNRRYILHCKSKTRMVWRIINRENGKWISYSKEMEIN